MTLKFVFDPLSTSGFGRIGKNWVLCIGAGVNAPVLPDWDNLVKTLIEETFGASFLATYGEIQVRKSWSADSWIQVCLNRFLDTGGTYEKFRSVLSDIIYHPLYIGRSATERALLTKGFSRSGKLGKKEFFTFGDILIDAFKNTTVFALANILCEEKYAKKLPFAILNFNADIILDILVFILNKRNLAARNNNFDDPPLILNRISNRVAAQNYFRMFENRIPVYHIHGSVFPSDQHAKHAQQVSDLVFEENSYADMAQNAYAWGQTIFLSLCQDRQMVFLGLSMKDPNIRKWLIFSQTQDNETLTDIAQVKDFTGRHIWIDRAAGTKDPLLLDYLTRHLGVKIATIHNWERVGPALKSLVGLH